MQDINVGATDPLEAAANGHSYVDLGLRKTVEGKEYAVLFADRNIGADSPEEYGDYFQWGDTQVRYSNISTYDSDNGDYSFNISNCVWHNGNNPMTDWTKYIDTYNIDYWSGTGDPDNKLILDPTDDVASVLWGGDWKMPDKEELEILKGPEVTIDYTNNYNNTGVNGVLIRGKGTYASASIFLPATGMLQDIYIEEKNGVGYYWSRTLYTDYPDNACGLTFEVSEETIDNLYQGRYIGQNIRPVLVVPSSWL